MNHVLAIRACSAWDILCPGSACVVEVELGGGPASVEGMVRLFLPSYMCQIGLLNNVLDSPSRLAYVLVTTPRCRELCGTGVSLSSIELSNEAPIL